MQRPSLILLASAVMLGIAQLSAAHAQSAGDVVTQIEAVRLSNIENFRRLGPRGFDNGQLQQAAMVAFSVAESATDPLVAAKALYEYGSIARMLGERDAAIAALTQAAQFASDGDPAGVGFDALIGLARSHLGEPMDLASAEQALALAEAASSMQPTAKTRFQLASYQAEIMSLKGDLPTGIIASARALELAAETGDPSDRFYTHLGLADLFQKMVQQCDYGGHYETCKKALGASDAAYAGALRVTEERGWAHLSQMLGGLRGGLQSRGQLLEWKIAQDSFERSAGVFAPASIQDVSIDTEFGAGGSKLAGTVTPEFVEQAIAASAAQSVSGQEPGARTYYLAGIAADLRGQFDAGALHYLEAVRRLEAVRASVFDPRRRGTAIETSVEFYETAALRQLDFRNDAVAVEMLERGRARGLAELLALADEAGISSGDRRALSQVVSMEAEISLNQLAVVAAMLEAKPPENYARPLARLEALEHARGQLLRSQSARFDRLMQRAWLPVSLADLQERAAAHGVAVLQYWATGSDVVVWYIGRNGSHPRSVFLPRSVLEEKVRALRGSILERERTPGDFDAKTARELYLFLVAPLAEWIDEEKILVVPHGILTELPFETLIDPRDGRFLIEKAAVSYAPNMTFAAKVLGGPSGMGGRVVAVSDPRIDALTGEVSIIKDISGGKAEIVSIDGLEADRFARLVGDASTLHMSVHGLFNPREPLLSKLEMRLEGAKRDMVAADLLAYPFQDTRLVVMAACESGRGGARISNEVFGIPWALLVSGAGSIVMSRWRVNNIATARWVEAFYRAGASGASIAEAGRQAMLAVYGSEERRHPYFWAGPQVTGG